MKTLAPSKYPLSSHCYVPGPQEVLGKKGKEDGGKAEKRRKGRWGTSTVFKKGRGKLNIGCWML